VKKFVRKIKKKLFPAQSKPKKEVAKVAQAPAQTEKPKQQPKEKPKKPAKGIVDVLPGEEEFFNEKSMYTGIGMYYMNKQFLPKEDRAAELKQLFYKKVGYYLNLKYPKSFNEKINWIKLNYFHPDMARCVCKYEFKNYIEEKLGPGYTLPLYGAWEDEADIDFDALPDKFVLKSNVQSDGKHIIVVRDKSKLDIDKLRTVLSSWLITKNTMCVSYCRAYHDVKPMIIAEQYLEGFDDSVTDYKFMCFNGEPKLLFVATDRYSDMRMNFYDLDWNLLPFTRIYPISDEPIQKPKNFDRMLEISKELAKDFPFVRVDFYETADSEQIYLGEMTFYPGGGLEPFTPVEWDYKLGDMLELPEANC